MVNSMLSYSGLSDGFWGEAMLTACYLLNRVPNKRNKVTPYKLWYKKKPNLNYLRIWGCRAVVRLPEPKKKSLGERGIDCIFIGYAEHSKAYRFYVIAPNDFISVNTVIESRDAIFDETRFSSIPRPQERIPSTSGTSKETESFKVTPDEPMKLRKSKRVRKPKSFGPDFQLYLIEGSRDEVSTLYPYCFNVEDDPKIFDEAMKSQDVAFWKEAINDEMDSIMGNNTWVLADLPPGCTPLGCKWIFKKKMKVDGTIEKFKARLVIQGFRQRPGIDYFDTYAPVARISTIRLLIALASIHNLVIHQMDVKTAFLNGDLDEEVYMKQPEGFIMPGNEHKVCKLVKSLYGLKQAPKQWHQKFDEVVLSSGYRLNQSDKCVYSKFDNSGNGVIICLYVDDMLIFGTNQHQVDLTKDFLSSRFSMKDMGEADVILGIRIIRENKGISISQSHYIEKVLKKFNCFDCTPVSTPIDPSVKLMPNTGKAVSQLEYSKVIGCLMYAMTSTRPDIAYAVGKLSRFTSIPSTHHWQAIRRVLKYLKKTMFYGLSYSGSPSVLEGYSDASWITNVEDHSSTSGWVFLLGGGAISWASKKQTCITNSTMESEFIALAAAGKEAEWLRNLIHEIPLWPKPISPISIYCDSAATLAKASSQMYNGKSRHLGVRHSMIRDLIMNGVISVEFVRSQHNLADHLTKGLARDLVHKSVIGMGLKSM
ncbi:UNVERIFIED_CONTAM: Retrovirus-related Pol polyprotein from transposon TNT 1-94 [Sesamum radiatum]|uniref:Retrovirus-related Pol polyprotein from transposon TNT 1-94 n=1 Tax=Sesamum radiatum TaxID=300843 RepID=A0AAW2L395_SESRA